MQILISYERNKIKQWSKECISLSLYRQDGVIRNVFEENSNSNSNNIILMCYLPNIAWSVYCRSKVISFIKGHVYVHPTFRHQGIGHRMSHLIYDLYQEKLITPERLLLRIGYLPEVIDLSRRL